MSQYDIEKIVEALNDYIGYGYNKRKLLSLIKKFQKMIEENKVISEREGVSGIYKQFEDLVDLFSRSSTSEPLVMILKNENEKFDIYVFRHGLKFCLNEVTSSEKFMGKLRKNPKEGMVIGDVKPKEVLDFLKAYYIFRVNPEQIVTAQNIAYDYSKDCLEMVSILEEFSGVENGLVIEKKNAILYDDEALPYDLGYLNKYKRTLADDIEFATILTNVREDKYLGTSLNKVSRWWI